MHYYAATLTNMTFTSHLCLTLIIPVPIVIGIPMIMDSLTPPIESSLPRTDAWKRISAVLSNDASINTLLPIFEIPNLFIPRI